MPTANKIKIYPVIETLSGPKNTKTLYAICKKKGASLAIILALHKNRRTIEQANQDIKFLSRLQESILENLVIEFAKSRTILNSFCVRGFSGKILKTGNLEGGALSTSSLN